MRAKLVILSAIAFCFCFIANGQVYKDGRIMTPMQVDSFMSSMPEMEKLEFMMQIANATLEAFSSGNQNSINYFISLFPVLNKHLNEMNAQYGEFEMDEEFMPPIPQPYAMRQNPMQNMPQMQFPRQLNGADTRLLNIFRNYQNDISDMREHNKRSMQIQQEAFKRRWNNRTIPLHQ